MGLKPAYGLERSKVGEVKQTIARLTKVMTSNLNHLNQFNYQYSLPALFTFAIYLLFYFIILTNIFTKDLDFITI